MIPKTELTKVDQPKTRMAYMAYEYSALDLPQIYASKPCPGACHPRISPHADSINHLIGVIGHFGPADLIGTPLSDRPHLLAQGVYKKS